MNITRKTKKLIKNPAVFFRDYFNKHYPPTYTELHLNAEQELAVLLAEQDNKIQAKHQQPVDVVYTWVDNHDKAWQDKCHFYKQQYEQDGTVVGRFATDVARFENHDELYYSVCSVKKHLPWIRNIYIVTDNQTPAWLSQFENVFVVFHSQIIDEAYLPTFNSHVIEAHLHKIPNLAENFLYFNDDVFVAKPLSYSHFFESNGLASLFVSAKQLEELARRGLNTATLHACFNAKKLLEKHYDICITHTLVHTYFPLKKSMYEKAWQLFYDDITAFLSNKFRTNQDLNLATFVVPYLMYCNQLATEKAEVCYYFNIRSNNAPFYYHMLLNKKHNQEMLPHSFCANDFNAESQLEDYHKQLSDFLKAFYR